MNRFLPFLSKLAAAFSRSDGWVSSPPSPLRPRYHPLGEIKFGYCLDLKNIASAVPVIALILSACVTGFSASDSSGSIGQSVAQCHASSNLNKRQSASGFNTHHDRLTFFNGDSNISVYQLAIGISLARPDGSAKTFVLPLSVSYQTASHGQQPLYSTGTSASNFNTTGCRRAFGSVSPETLRGNDLSY